jgi:hypothetical protein
MTRLLPRLEAYGDDFAHLIKKLSSLDGIREIAAILPFFLACEKGFSSKVEEIRGHIEKLSEQCDPKS